jgi:hypothetical protein
MITEINVEGRALGHAVKAALSADWTVVVEDCDAWLRSRNGAPPAEWELVPPAAV